MRKQRKELDPESDDEVIIAQPETSISKSTKRKRGDVDDVTESKRERVDINLISHKIGSMGLRETHL